MQSASFESTFPIMGGLVWMRTYHAMYATPITPRAIALGNLLWIVARLTMITTIFTVVIVLFGAAESPLIVLPVPAAALTGTPLAGPIAARPPRPAAEVASSGALPRADRAVAYDRRKHTIELSTSMSQMPGLKLAER